MNHTPRKRFGQHFLHDPAVIRDIIDAIAPEPDELMVEIGPGQGAITDPLLKRVNTLHAVELDRDLAAALRKRYAESGKLQLHEADALRFDFTSLGEAGQKIRIVGNLPYNVSSPLLFWLAEQADAIQDMHFMLQKEVVERICAAPGSKTYGRLSVTLGSYCDAEKLFRIGKGAFQPPPKVESAFLRLTPMPKRIAAVYDRATFQRIVRAAFGQRRKTLRNALKNIVDEEALTRVGIEPGLRAETLSVDQYVALANHVTPV